MGKHKHHHKKGPHKLERWLSRETHKFLAEFAVLVLAAWTAEGLMGYVFHAVKAVLA